MKDDLHNKFELSLYRFCGATKPSYTQQSPLYSTTSTVNVFFKTADVSGIYQYATETVPPDFFYSGFQLCFQAGMALFAWANTALQDLAYI